VLSDFGSLPLCDLHSLGWAFWPLLPKPFLCAHLLSTHLSRGRKLSKSSWHVPWFYSDERLDTCCSLFCAHVFTFGLCLVLEWWTSC
jgi:hypothetical protein